MPYEFARTNSTSNFFLGAPQRPWMTGGLNSVAASNKRAQQPPQPPRLETSAQRPASQFRHDIVSPLQGATHQNQAFGPTTISVQENIPPAGDLSPAFHRQTDLPVSSWNTDDALPPPPTRNVPVNPPAGRPPSDHGAPPPFQRPEDSSQQPLISLKRLEPLRFITNVSPSIPPNPPDTTTPPAPPSNDDTISASARSVSSPLAQNTSPTFHTTSALFPHQTFRPLAGQVQLTPTSVQSSSPQSDWGPHLAVASTGTSNIHTPQNNSIPEPLPPSIHHLMKPMEQLVYTVHRAIKVLVDSRKMELLDRNRFRLLLEACEVSDSFYLLLHQLYCLSTVNPTVVSQVLSPFVVKSLPSLRDLLLANTSIGYRALCFFATFPVDISDFAHPFLKGLLTQVEDFVQSFSLQWNQERLQSISRGFPLCAVEFLVRLKANWPVIQEILFNCLHRNLYPADQVRWEPTARALFSAHRKNCLAKSMRKGSIDVTVEVQAFGQMYKAIRAHFISGQPMPADLLNYISRSSPPQPQTNTFQQSLIQPGQVQSSTTFPAQFVPPGGSASSQSQHSPNLPAQFMQNGNSAMIPSQPQHNPIFPSQLMPLGNSTTIPNQPNLSPTSPLQFQASGNSATTPNQAQGSPIFAAQFSSSGNSTTTSNQALNQYRHHPLSFGVGSIPNIPDTSSLPSDAQSSGSVSSSWRAPFYQISDTNRNATQPTTSPIQLPTKVVRSSPHATRTPLLPRTGASLGERVDPRPSRMALHQAHLFSPKAHVSILPERRLYQQLEAFLIPPQAVDATNSFKIWKFNVDHELLQKRIERVESETEQDPNKPRQFVPGKVLFRLKSVESSSQKQKSQLDDWSALPTKWPGCLFISANTCADVQVRRKTHWGKDLPADLTDIVVAGANEITVSSYWRGADAQKQFHLALEVIEVFDHTSMLQKPSSLPMNTALAAITGILQGNGAEDDELVAIDQTVNIDVTDPFTSVLWNVPVRGHNCIHRECFDLEAFLLSRTSRHPGAPTDPDEWRCPICRRDARPSRLIIDEFLQEVRQTLEEKGQLSTKSIAVDAYGNWTARLDDDSILKENHTDRTAQAATTGDLKDENEIDGDGSILDTTSTSKQISLGRGEENHPIVIDLDDDD